MEYRRTIRTERGIECSKSHELSRTFGLALQFNYCASKTRQAQHPERMPFLLSGSQAAVELSKENNKI